jgi:ribonuclease J
MIYNVINNLSRMGAQVIYEALADVHVSGHACREELKLIHALVKPKFFIPVHGEYRHLSQHVQMAVEMGQPAHTAFIADIGHQVILTKNSMKKCDNIPAGVILVDGVGMGDMESSVLRDRKRLSEDGVLVAVIQVNMETGKVDAPPDIITRGLAYSKESDVLTEELRRVVSDSIADLGGKAGDISGFKDAVRKALRNYLMKKLKRSPMILPIVIES